MIISANVLPLRGSGLHPQKHMQVGRCWTMPPSGKGTDYKKLEAIGRTIADGHQSVNITRIGEIFFDYRATNVDVFGDAHWRVF